MSLIEELRERNATAQDAARELGRGLMRGRREELKLGYSWENAALAATGAFTLPELDATELKVYLLGFAAGLTGETPVAEEVLKRLDNASERFRAAYETGFSAGNREDREQTYPAEVEDAATKAALRRREELTMNECGCGATTPSECCAAVEGYFTSLSQRSNEELQELHEGDGCEAARVLLVRRRHDREAM